MEQIYQIAWVCLISTLMINASVFWIAPYYICPQGVCSDPGFTTIQNQAGAKSNLDLNGISNVLSSEQSGAVSGTQPTTPSGFWGFIGGTATELLTGQPAGGLLGLVIIPLVAFVFPVQSILLYYANYFQSGIFKAIIYVITAFFTAVQVIGITFLIIYIAGLIRGVKA